MRLLPLKPLAIGCVLALANSAVAAEQKSYSFEDLQQLATQRAWTELITHLQDVRPAERGAAWQALVDRAGVEFLRSLTTSVSLDEVIRAGKVVVLQYPQLADNAEFTGLYLPQAEQYYASCYRYRNADCTNEYAQILAHFSAPAEMMFAQGQQALRQVSYTASVPFFAQAVQRDPGYCSEEDVAKGVLETLALPKHSHFRAAFEVATQHCLDYKLSGADGYLKHATEVQEVLCQPYLNQGYVKGLTKKVCELIVAG